MAIQPIFRADPNAVPQINGLPGVVSGAQKGYQLAQLPEQMKMEKMLKAAQLEKDQLYNKYYAPSQEADIANKQANTGYTQANTGYVNKQTDWYDRKAQDEINRNAVLNANTRANTSLTSTQAAGAADDLSYQRQLYAALQAAQNGQQQQAPSQSMAPPQPQYQPGQGGAPYAAPQQNAPSPQMQGGSAPMQGAPQQQNQAMAQPQPSQAMDGAPHARVLQQGNSSLSYLDDIAANPLYAAQMAKMKMPGIKTENKFDKDGNLQVLTTYPSGKTTLESVQLQDPAEQAQQAQMAELNKKIADQGAIKYGDYTKELGSAVKIQGDIESLANAINVPEFDDAVGPVNNFFHKNLGMGDDATNKLFGTINSTTGLIQGEMANSISGNAAKAKLYFAQMIKPSASDPAPVFRGKLEAINAANKWNVDYNSYVAKAIRTGTPVDEAILQADKAVPWSKYQGQMSAFLKNGELANKYQSQGLAVSYQDSGQGDHHPYVDVKTPEGGTLSIPVEKYQTYLAQINKAAKNG